MAGVRGGLGVKIGSQNLFTSIRLLEGARFALGLVVGFTASVFLFLLLDMADLGVAVDSTLLGAVIGGILAGSTALLATLVTSYFLLVENSNKEKAQDEVKALSIYIKVHSARDSIVKSYRHHFDGSPGNTIRYGQFGQIWKPLAFSGSDTNLTDDEITLALKYKNAEIFNLLMDAKAMIDLHGKLAASYERQFNQFQKHIFDNNRVNIDGQHLSGEVKIDRLELLAIEDLRNVFKSFLLRSHQSIVQVHSEVIAFLSTEFSRTISFADDPSIPASADNFYEGLHGG
jgi:hypothetical protein